MGSCRPTIAVPIRLELPQKPTLVLAAAACFQATVIDRCDIIAPFLTTLVIRSAPKRHLYSGVFRHSVDVATYARDALPVFKKLLQEAS